MRLQGCASERRKNEERGKKRNKKQAKHEKTNKNRPANNLCHQKTRRKHVK